MGALECQMMNIRTLYSNQQAMRTAIYPTVVIRLIVIHYCDLHPHRLQQQLHHQHPRLMLNFIKPFVMQDLIFWNDFHVSQGSLGILPVRKKRIHWLTFTSKLLVISAHVLDHPIAKAIIPLLPPSVQAMRNNDTVQQTMNDYDRATYYLAQW